MLRRLAPTRLAGLGLGLGLVALVLAMPSFGAASAQATVKPKPKYRLAVTISGTPTTITLNKPYTFTVKITNTGRLKFAKGVKMAYADGRFVTGASPMFNSTYKSYIVSDSWVDTWKNIGSIKVGASRTVKVYVTFDDPGKVHRGSFAIVDVYLHGIGTSYSKEVQKYPNY